MRHRIMIATFMSLLFFGGGCLEPRDSSEIPPDKVLGASFGTLSFAISEADAIRLDEQNQRLVLRVFQLDGDSKGSQIGEDLIIADLAGPNFELANIPLGWKRIEGLLEDGEGAVVATAVVDHLVVPGVQTVSPLVFDAPDDTIIPELVVQFQWPQGVIEAPPFSADQMTELQNIVVVACVECHGADAQTDLSQFPIATTKNAYGNDVLPQKIVGSVRHDSDVLAMPYFQDKLPENEIKLFEDWLASITPPPPSDGGLTIDGVSALVTTSEGQVLFEGSLDLREQGYGFPQGSEISPLTIGSSVSLEITAMVAGNPYRFSRQRSLGVDGKVVEMIRWPRGELTIPIVIH